MRFRSLLCCSILLIATAWVGTASAQTIYIDGPGISVGYYAPQYYYDYLVFFDDTGQPYYYRDGARFYVPHTYAGYRSLRRHYNRHRPHYRRWYRERGYRHHRYRRRVDYAPMYYDGYIVYYDGSGQPYYYLNGRTVYVPRHHARYGAYRTHYRRHGSGYRRWHKRHGRSYRNHRHKTHRYGRRVTAPPAHRRTGGHRVGVNCSRNPGHPSCRRGSRHGASPPRRHGGPGHRAAPPRHGHQPTPRGHRGARRGGGVDCSRNPGHPSCRRGSRHGASPRGHRGGGRGGGHKGKGKSRRRHR